MDSFGFKLRKAIRIALRIMTGSACTWRMSVLYCSSALGECIMGIPVMDMRTCCKNRGHGTAYRGKWLQFCPGFLSP
jgi:hypothetical protein